MSDPLIWFLTVEALGVAAFPLMARLFRGFPDRGWGLSKAAGLLLVGFLNWWLGSVVSLGNYPLLLWLCLLAVLAVGCVLQRDLRDIAGGMRALATTIAIEEILFVAAFVGWTFVRMQNPGILGTEKPMDFMLLQVSGATHSFPPPDAWLSGHTVNYYYLGYSLFAMLGRMSGVAPRFAYSLANITIFALGCVSAYSIALALVKDRRWAIGGPVALMLAGDLDGVGQLIEQAQQSPYTWSFDSAGQLLSQVVHGTFSWPRIDLICSTRIIAGGCSSYKTIDEFPIFSLIWNDLHPHVMAIPFALLAVGTALSLLLTELSAARDGRSEALTLVFAGVVAGSLFPINSWDFPTYLALIAGCALISRARHHALVVRDWVLSLAIVPVSVVFYLPYYLTVSARGQGVGFQSNPTEIREMLTVIGALILPAGILAFWRVGAAVVHDATLAADSDLAALVTRLPAGWGYLSIGGVFLLLVVLPARTDLLLLAIVASALYALGSALRRDQPEMTFALAVTALGALILLLGDYVYLRDIFDKSPQYRMNTVFKLYYQAWILLSFAAVYGVAALWRAARTLHVSARWLVAVPAAILTLLALVYPIAGIPSTVNGQIGSGSLDGLISVQQADPQEYAALQWIMAHTSPSSVIAEAVGTDAPAGNCGEYWVCDLTQSFNKVSALTGRPTIIGWPGSHESLWRDAYADPAAAAMLQARERDVRTLYTTTDNIEALAILHTYHVSYVYVGPVERYAYIDGMHLSEAVFDKFSGFMKTVFNNGVVSIYQVP